MDRESRIKAAKSRIEELELLIKAWTPEPIEPPAAEGLKLTTANLKELQEITEAELKHYFPHEKTL